MSDLIDREARQVRDGGSVHKLHTARTGPDGREYWTRCGRTLHAAQGAVLTTTEAGCQGCARGRATTTADRLLDELPTAEMAGVR